MIVRVLVPLVIASSPVAAQIVEVGGGVAVPTGDQNVNRSPGIASHASVWFHPTPRWLVGPSFEYARLPFDRFIDENVLAAVGFTLSMFSLVGQARFLVAETGTLTPSVVIAAGVTRHRTAVGSVAVRDGPTYLLQPESLWGFTAAGGLGLNYRIQEDMSIQADARYVLTVFEETKPKRLQFEAALQLRVH